MSTQRCVKLGTLKERLEERLRIEEADSDWQGQITKTILDAALNRCVRGGSYETSDQLLGIAVLLLILKGEDE